VWLVLALRSGTLTIPWRGGPATIISRRIDPFGYWVVMGFLVLGIAISAWSATLPN
jgi:hypothetical protein